MRQMEERVHFNRDTFMVFLFEHADTIKEFGNSVGLSERTMTRMIADKALTANAAIKIAKTYNVPIETFAGDNWASN